MPQVRHSQSSQDLLFESLIQTYEEYGQILWRLNDLSRELGVSQEIIAAILSSKQSFEQMQLSVLVYQIFLNECLQTLIGTT